MSCLPSEQHWFKNLIYKKCNHLLNKYTINCIDVVSGFCIIMRREKEREKYAIRYHACLLQHARQEIVVFHDSLFSLFIDFFIGCTVFYLLHHTVHFHYHKLNFNFLVIFNKHKYISRTRIFKIYLWSSQLLSNIPLLCPRRFQNSSLHAQPSCLLCHLQSSAKYFYFTLSTTTQNFYFYCC